MTTKAYVLIEIQVGKSKKVVEDIRRLKGVISVDSVTGPYDAIAVLETENLNVIGELVTSKFYPISGISRTVTCLAVKSS